MSANSMNLFKMAKKWKKRASSQARFTDKGHFVVYTTDMTRFVVPLSCLDDEIFRELLRLSEEEFGLIGGGPIMLPCDAFFVEYVISLINNNRGGGLEKALILSIFTSRCSSDSGFDLQQRIVC